MNASAVSLRRSNGSVVAVFLVLLGASAAFADVYTHKDAEGVFHFSEVPTPGFEPFMRAGARSHEESASSTAPAAPAEVEEPIGNDPFGIPELEEYDPWAAFNEWTFAFNYRVDRYIVKPAARAWTWILPEAVRRSLGNGFRNLDTPRRLANNLFQFKGGGAAREVGRFVINSTIGIAGLFDVAKTFGIEKSDEDMGQTLAVYGAGPGPYVVVPFLPPLTVRDGIGFGMDGFLSPWGYLFPFAARAGTTLSGTVNERAENLALFQDAEESAIDLYSAVRNGYLQRRRKAVLE